jgi:hypothetical protein
MSRLHRSVRHPGHVRHFALLASTALAVACPHMAAAQSANDVVNGFAMDISCSGEIANTLADHGVKATLRKTF